MMGNRVSARALALGLHRGSEHRLEEMGEKGVSCVEDGTVDSRADIY